MRSRRSTKRKRSRRRRPRRRHANLSVSAKHKLFERLVVQTFIASIYAAGRAPRSAFLIPDRRLLRSGAVILNTIIAINVELAQLDNRAAVAARDLVHFAPTVCRHSSLFRCHVKLKQRLPLAANKPARRVWQAQARRQCSTESSQNCTVAFCSTYV